MKGTKTFLKTAVRFPHAPYIFRGNCISFSIINGQLKFPWLSENLINEFIINNFSSYVVVLCRLFVWIIVMSSFIYVLLTKASYEVWTYLN